MSRFAILASRVLLPGGFVSGRAVLVDAGAIAVVCLPDDLPGDAPLVEVAGDLVPGFIDLQVNGGGGVLFNDAPTVAGIRAIAKAHRAFGTTGFLPTLISDELSVVRAGIDAVDAAIAAGVPGVLGIHVEGPFLNPARRGIHDPARLRAIDGAAIELLASLKHGRTLVTLAPERAPPGTIRALVDRGVIVAAGHSDASYEEMRAAIDEGLRGVTHLFNAMSQLRSRAPGVVGAALDDRSLWCGVIVDGRHVHPATLRIALAAKGSDRIALVTDAMPPVGSDSATFDLHGRTIRARDGSCYADDGTLAGSALSMIAAVRNAHDLLHVDLATAIRMASDSPARAIGIADSRGAIRPGLRADLVLIDARRDVVRSWIDGVG